MTDIDELFEAPEEGLERLAALGQSLAKKRDEAVDGRRNSGIEAIWMACEEAYVGLDEANRGEFNGARWAKPTSMQGPVEQNDQARVNNTRSTVFVRLTARYTDAAAAKLGEIILPIDDKAFSFEATPVPDLVEKLDDKTPANFPDGTPMLRDPKEGEPEDAKVQITVGDFAKESVEKAEKAAKKAETRIYDWMVESQYQAEMRKVLFDGARIGVGVLKAPFPKPTKATAITRTEGGVVLQVVEKIIPGSKWVDPWNFFPDPSCGENIHDGDHCLERDFLTPRQLRNLKKIPGYLPDQVDKVLKEGPDKRNVESGPRKDQPKDNRYQVFYFYGEISRDDMMLANCHCQDIPADQPSVFAIVTLVNDTVIRAVLNPLDSGSFPYHAFPWQRRPGSWAGVGVAEQVSVPQRIVTAATRALLNNAGQSAGVQIVVDKTCITPADNQWVVTPNKIWYKGAEATADDVAKAFQVFQIPNATSQLQAIIEYGFRLAEESSSIPLITQGQSGKTTPDTLGGMQLQNNNANQLLRNVGYNVDDFITEPAVRAYYEWLLMDPDVPDDEKGDFKINAHGSSAMIERSIQDQTLLQLGQMVMNPIFEMSPKKWFGEMLKSKKLNPIDFEMDEEEKQAQANTQPPPAPAVQAAQIREQGAVQRAQLHEQEETKRTQLVVNAETQAKQAETEQDAAQRQADREMEYQIAVLKYANDRQITLEQAKADLAKVVMQLNTQKTLAGVRGDQVATPPTEPPGRAEPGMAYQQ